MKMYKDMNHEELVSLHDDLCKQYEQVKAKGLKLNMARGKPDVNQLLLSTDILDVINSHYDFGSQYEYCNYGILDGIDESCQISEQAKEQVEQMLKSAFRPEFLNRLDEIVYYKSLTKDEMRKIVDLQLADLRSRMDEGKHLNLDVTTAAKDYIIDSAYDSVYGARPIKRFIQSRVETLIAKAIIQGRYAEGSTLTVDYDGNALVLK